MSELANELRVTEILGRRSCEAVVVNIEFGKVREVRCLADVFEPIVANLILNEIDHSEVSNCKGLRDEHGASASNSIRLQLEFGEERQVAVILNVLSTLLINTVLV